MHDKWWLGLIIAIIIILLLWLLASLGSKNKQASGAPVAGAAGLAAAGGATAASAKLQAEEARLKAEAAANKAAQGTADAARAAGAGAAGAASAASADAKLAAAEAEAGAAKLTGSTGGASAPKIDFGGGAAHTAGSHSGAHDASHVPDLVAGREALGRSKKLSVDDLTVVEGIGPKIAGVLNNNGVTTWYELSNAQPETIKEWLEAAGPQFNMHEPGTWPHQAHLLHNGQWAEFLKLTAELDGGVED